MKFNNLQHTLSPLKSGNLSRTMSFHQIIDQINAQKIVVLGDLMLDEYIQGNSHRISPEAPVPIVAVNSLYHVPGGAANTAANISSLGAQAVLIGVIGSDDDGIKFKKALQKKQVLFSPITIKSPTTKKTRVLGDKQQIVRIDHETKFKLTTAIEKKILSQFKKHIKSSDCVVFSDYAKGFFTADLCQKLIQITHKNKKTVIVDPRPANAEFYRGCDTITPNWKEAHEILGKVPGPVTKESVKSVALKLRTKMKANILLTLGADGLYYLPKNKTKPLSIATDSQEVFDVSGAGDTVVSAFSIALSAKAEISDCLSFANKAAGIVVGKMGTSTVSASELIEPTNQGLLQRKDLIKWSRKMKDSGKKIVTINGSFDLLHSGHLHILKESKKLGDVLLVGLNSDSSVRKYKGTKRPIISQSQRAEMLLSLNMVDYVHVFNEDNPIAFLKKAEPHFHVNGSEYGEKCIEADTVTKGGGIVKIIKLINNLSTSAVIQKIKNS